MNLDGKNISKGFENNNEIRSFISLHKKYDELKDLCEDGKFSSFSKKLASNKYNKCLFYTGLETGVDRKHSCSLKENKFKKYAEIIKETYGDVIIKHELVKTKIPCDKNKWQKILVSVLFHVTFNKNFPNSISKHLHIIVPLEYDDFHG